MKRERGFSMLEMFVAIAIVGLVAALLLPAVNMVRENARAAKCLSNLRQLGLAAHQYEGVHGMFPGCKQEGTRRFIFPTPPPEGELYNNLCSISSQFLPYLDEARLFEQLNLSGNRVPELGNVSAPEWNMLATVMNLKVAAFLCPSDSGGLSPGNNYRACLGSGPIDKFSAEFPDSGNGFFAPIYDQPGGGFPIRMSAMIDGLSHTAMFAERLKGAGDEKRFHPRRDASLLSINPITASQSMVLCRTHHELSLAGERGWHPWFGRYWITSDFCNTLYNHVLPPNSAIADCTVGHGLFGPASARSNHPGGVHVCFGDASARVVSDGVSLSVWRSISTRNGGEIVIAGSY